KSSIRSRPGRAAIRSMSSIRTFSPRCTQAPRHERHTLMRGQARRHFSVNPEEMLKNLAGLTGPKRNTPVGSLPVIPWDPKAEQALKGFYDLRAFALRFLDTDFVTAVRPVPTEQA